MPRITVIQKGKSLVNVALEGRNLALPNNSQRDATCTVEDGIITGPADLLEKIQDGTITVVDWHGHRIEGMEKAEEPLTPLQQHLANMPADERKSLREAAKDIKADLAAEKSADDGKPVTKETKAKPPVKVTPPASVGNLLQQPNEVTE